MSARLRSSFPLIVVAALLAWSTGQAAILLVVTLGAAVALPLAVWLDPQPLVQRLTLASVAIVAASGGAAFFLGPDVDGTSHPSHALGVIATTAVLLSLTRRFFLAPEGGDRPDIALQTAVLLVCGQKHLGTAFHVAVGLFLAAVVVIFRGRDPRVGWSVVERNAPWAILAMLGVTGTAALGAIVALPRLSELTHNQFDHFIVPLDVSHTGFTDRLRPGLPDPLLRSETLVLRVYGPHTDYLRGRVYDRYDRGAWESTLRGPILRVSADGHPSPSTRTEVRTVAPTRVPASQARYFVPLGVRSLATSSGFALVDATGTVRPDGEPPTSVSFEAGASELPVAPPGEEDLRVPGNLVAPLRELATSWTRDAHSPATQLAAIERHLHEDFTYSLEPDDNAHREPLVLHFLFHSRRGHCEYFATAMALLARTVGVPARAVGGYRVAEHNSFGGYDVVREKNAHAWVEAWLGPEGNEAWRTYDPTPMTEANMSREAGGAAALADAIAAGWDRLLDMIGRARPWQFALGLGVAIGLLVIVRALRARRARRGRVETDSRDVPLAAFARLEALLGQAGHRRGDAEPLEAYAARLEGAEYRKAARLVLSYGAHRYGGLGEVADISRHLEACANELEAANT